MFISGYTERQDVFEPIPPRGAYPRVLTLQHVPDTSKTPPVRPVYRLGTYMGEYPYPYSANTGGSPWGAQGAKNPKIILDGDGRVVWGCECWWFDMWSLNLIEHISSMNDEERQAVTQELEIMVAESPDPAD